MTIVPIGKVVLQGASEGDRETYLHGLIGGMEEAIKEVVKRCIEAELGLDCCTMFTPNCE